MLPRSYVVLVPVKPPAVAKSRLVGVPDDLRRDLAAAFARDTVTACLAATGVAAVMVVTDDAQVAADLDALGCSVLPDRPGGDLNATLVRAAAEAGRRWPELQPVALCADLPALRPADLAAALASAVEGAAAFVADADGVGTTLYTAPYAAFRPRFGVASRAAHLADGANEIGGDLATLRRDVDDTAGLARARELGLGAHTAALERQ